MRRRLASAPVARLATAGPGGRPHLVPVCFALAGDDVYWAVDLKPKSGPRLRRLANLAADPRAALLADHYDQDWSRLWWVRADCRAAILEPGPDADAGLDRLAAKYPQYRLQRPPGPVVRMRVERWTGWAAEVEPGPEPGPAG